MASIDSEGVEDWMHLAGPKWAQWIGTVGMAGLSPIAPGTAGSLVALPVAVLLSFQPLWLQITVFLVVTVVGTLAAHVLAQHSSDPDPQYIVIDEFAGMLLTLMGMQVNVWIAIGGFALFRIFDMTKPFPISWLDRNIHGGVGIVLDDLAAGVAARLVLALVVVLS